MHKLVAPRWGERRRGWRPPPRHRAASWSSAWGWESGCLHRAPWCPPAAGTVWSLRAAGCGLRPSFRMALSGFSPATVGQEHQVWAATSQCHSHEEGRQRGGQLGRGSAPDPSHGHCDSAGRHPLRRREQSEAALGRDLAAQSPGGRWAVDGAAEVPGVCSAGGDGRLF